MLTHVGKMYQTLPLLSGESQRMTQPMSHFALKTGRPRCYVKSPTVQDAIPGLNSHTGVTGRWGLLSHARKAVLSFLLGPKIVN